MVSPFRQLPFEAQTHLCHLICSVTFGSQINSSQGRCNTDRGEQNILVTIFLTLTFEKVKSKACICFIQSFHCSEPARRGRKDAISERLI